MRNENCAPGTPVKPVETLRNVACESIQLINECNIIADEIEGKLLHPYPQEACDNAKEPSTDNLEGELNLIFSRIKRIHGTLMGINRKL